LITAYAAPDTPYGVPGKPNLSDDLLLNNQ